MLTLHYGQSGICRSLHRYTITDSAGTRLWTGSNKRKAFARIKILLKESRGQEIKK